MTTSDYMQYGGKCKEFAEKLVWQDPGLRLVRGYYHCPLHGKQEHWWAQRDTGEIVDPTAKQFASKGAGEYEEFDGIIQCSECGVDVREEETIMMGRFPVCSDRCAMRLVGVSNPATRNNQ